MPLYAFLSIVDSLFCFGIASVLLIRGRRQAWSLILLLYLSFLWVALPWIAWLAPAPFEPIVARYLYLVATWVPTLLTLFALSILERPLSHWSLKLSFVLSVLFMIFINHPLFTVGMRFTSVDVVPIPGPLFPLFIAFFTLLGAYSLMAIFQAYRKADLLQKAKFQWIALAFLAASIGVAIHFASVYTGSEPVPHDIFSILFASLIGYAVLKRSLYNIELLTRDAACNIATTLLMVLPLVSGRLLAPVADQLNHAAWIQTLGVLLAALFFFSLAVTLVRYEDNRTAVSLCRLFLNVALLNALLLMWAAPRNLLSVPLTRMLFLVSGWILLAWIDYLRHYFRDPPQAGFSLYNLWRAGVYVVMILTAATPWVVKDLFFYSPSLRPEEVLAGPFLRFYEYGWLVNFVGGGVWLGIRHRRALKKGSVLSGVLLVLAMGIAPLAGTSLLHFLSGATHRPWFALLEVLSGLALTRTFLMQPQTGHKPTPFSLRLVFVSLIASCLAGFMLSYGIWIQLLAAVLLVVSVPGIWEEVRESAEALVDHYVFQEKFSYLAEIERIGEDMFRSTNLPGLLRHLAEDLARRTALAWAGVWLYDLSEGRFLLRQAAGLKNTNLDRSELYKVSFDSKDALTQSLKPERGLLVVEDLLASAAARDVPGAPALEGRAAEELKRTDLAAAFPIYLGPRLIGFIGFGVKEDHSLFHQADRETLANLGSKAERAIGQAYMLYEQSLMFSKLAHDTLNFLHAMGMNMDILQNEYLGPLNDKQKKQLAIAAHQKELIRESLIDLRELERLMVLRIQGTWSMGPYDLRRLIEEALKAYEPRASAHGVTIDSRLHAAGEALGDARSVRRVIDNLLVNALKYVPDGGKVRVEVDQDGDNFLLRVADTGPGIPPEELGRIFDPFYRGPSGTAIARGTGLGLSVVREVANLHKGNVSVQSTVGIGTTFTVRLPSMARHKEFGLNFTADPTTKAQGA